MFATTNTTPVVVAPSNQNQNLSDNRERYLARTIGTGDNQNHQHTTNQHQTIQQQQRSQQQKEKRRHR